VLNHLTDLVDGLEELARARRPDARTAATSAIADAMEPYPSRVVFLSARTAP
jgi:hypothetical protein